LKQVINGSYDERMTVMISDPNALNKNWEPGGHPKQSVSQTVLYMLRELSKLNPQGHVHFQELYSSVNLLRRCPPGLIISILMNQPWARYLGDMYFRLEENREANNNDE
jgi:hypothetical protein